MLLNLSTLGFIWPTLELFHLLRAFLLFDFVVSLVDIILLLVGFLDILVGFLDIGSV